MEAETIDYTAATVSTVDAGALAGIMAFMGIYSLIVLVVTVILLVAMWKIFVKAGKPGWAALIPIYNIVVLMEVCGRPGWWVIWYFVPIAQIVVMVLVSLDLAKKFGKSVAFAIFGLILFPIVGYPMLGFGKSEYKA